MDSFITKRKRSPKQEHSEERDVDDSDDDLHAKRQKTDVKLKRLYPAAENLRIEYGVLYTKDQADLILSKCEENINYNEGKLTEVFVFGKWHKVPRKQVAYGDEGLSYKFSGNCIPARPWPPFVSEIRDYITKVTGYRFNFVLVNRYKDGNDHMGEHKDDEEDLEFGHPIASLTIGQPRDFIFRHGDSRGKHAKRKIDPVKIVLEHGSLLMMMYPTNTYWYHSLPPRKTAPGIRINMTFRLMKNRDNTAEQSQSAKHDVLSNRKKD